MTNQTEQEREELMSLADEYAEAQAKFRMEDLYGTSKTYTANCKEEAMEARQALAAALLAADKPAKLEQSERAELIRELEIIARTQWGGFFPGSAAEHRKNTVMRAASLLAADKAGGEVAALTDAQQRMLHDFPILQQFHTKHALGPMFHPSCMCCGHQTHPINLPVAVKHMELPGVVICRTCKDASKHSKPNPPRVPDDVVKDRDYLAELGFMLEKQGDVWLVIDDCGCAREASLTERVLWDAMLKEGKV